ncbi:MAG: hypothetical protein ACREXK_14085 [Gammaproteobacteria bacterium]
MSVALVSVADGILGVLLPDIGGEPVTLRRLLGTPSGRAPERFYLCSVMTLFARDAGRELGEFRGHLDHDFCVCYTHAAIR